LLVHPSGELHSSPEVERILGYLPRGLADIRERFEIVLPSGLSAGAPTGLWRAGVAFRELQVWRDRESGRAFRLRVACQPLGENLIVALDSGSTEASRAAYTETLLAAVNRSLSTHGIENALREVLQLIVRLACELIGARYGALGVRNREGSGLSEFVYWGISPDRVRAIGRLPEGRGLLGAIINESRTLRVPRIADDPRSCGMPPGHPAMTSFLGTPLTVDGRAFGSFYLADKDDAPEFSAADAEALESFSAQASLTVKLAQQAERDQRSLFRAMIAHAPYGIAFIPATAGEACVNPAAEQMLGPVVDATDPAREFELLRPDGAPLPRDEWPSERALSGAATIDREVLIQRRGRPAMPALISAAPVAREDGEILGAIVVCQDMTAQKELERLRTEFTAQVAHDMRTPIQAVLLHAEALLRRASGEAAWVPVTTIKSIHNSGQRLSRLVSDLMDASRIEAGRLSLHREPVEVAAMVRATVEQLRPVVGDRQVLLEVREVAPVLADRVRLEQVLTNLIENAAKYSDAGKPIRVRVEPAGAGAAIAVQDEGQGIPRDELPHLFDRFFQGRRNPRKRTGLGLGLFIAQRIVEGHDGHIDVESSEGVGSTFRVWLPARR
jgi:signal transduction histidine kinase